MRWLYFLGVFLMVACSGSAESVVHAVLFYRPGCVYCHRVIEETLLPLVHQYGNDLQVVLVNADTDDGQRLLDRTADWFNLAEDDRVVPTLLVADRIIIGSADISGALPGIVEKGVHGRGLELPYVPGLQRIMRGLEPVAAEDLDEQPVARGKQALSAVVHRGLWERLEQDPYGNSLAIVLLVGMVGSGAVVGVRWLRQPLSNERWAPVAVPVLAVLGLAIASYLTYIDLSGSEVVCGIGNCHAVQESPYSQLLGVPVATIGLIGYVVILGVWCWQRFAPLAHARRTAWVLPALAAVGLLFSIYLTFVEPFVIGASCLWCLSSGAALTGILWLSRR